MTDPTMEKSHRSLSLRYRPELTGLRIPLALIILVKHSDNGVFPGSWEVMQVWFALSGFLITSIMLRERISTGKISIAKFYQRRALKIYPVLWIVIACMYVYVALVHVDNGWYRLNGDALASVFFYMDYLKALGHEAYGGFFGPLWALSVEEQFYLLWAPLLIFSTWRWGRKGAMWIAIVGVVAVTINREILWSVLGPLQSTGIRILFAFDTNADAIFAGCVLAILFSWGMLSNLGPRSKRVLAVAAAISTAYFVAVLFTIDVGMPAPYVWGMSVSMIVAFVVIAHIVASPDGVYSRVLSIRPIVHLGDMAYIIYVAHWPIYSLLNHSVVPSFNEFELLCVRLAVVLVFSEIVWQVMDKHVARFRRRYFSLDSAH
ncbi:MAG: acyltransferase family protein [Acidimicrobiales bacterium]